MAYQSDFVNASYGESPTPLTCDDRSIPQRESIQALTARRVACNPHNAFSVADPLGVISRAVARAVQMLVCAGAPPAWPTLGDLTAHWLKYRLGVCIDDVRVWTAGTFVNRSVAAIVMQLNRNIRADDEKSIREPKTDSESSIQVSPSMSRGDTSRSAPK
jgi:hypothetical protein